MDTSRDKLTKSESG